MDVYNTMTNAVGFETGDVEIKCCGCLEPLLMAKGDQMVMVVGPMAGSDETEVWGILCAECAKHKTRLNFCFGDVPGD